MTSHKVLSQLEKIANSSSEEMLNLLFIIYLKPHMEILESPSFHTASVEYKKNVILLRKYCFTGFAGSLSLETTLDIMHSNQKIFLLKFLSIFSGRLLQLRTQYILNLLPHSNGYGSKFLKSLSGYGTNKKIPFKYLINKNRNLYNLKKVLEILIGPCEILIKKYEVKNISHRNPQKKTLGDLCLGKKVNLIATGILIHLKSYQDFLHLDLNEIHTSIDFFTSAYKLKFYIPPEKIQLKNYLLSWKLNLKNEF
jgi:hypothetical protein